MRIPKNATSLTVVHYRRGLLRPMKGRFTGYRCFPYTMSRHIGAGRERLMLYFTSTESLASSPSTSSGSSVLPR